MRHGAQQMSSAPPIDMTMMIHVAIAVLLL
jgi:hypothetical protein